MGCPVTVGKTDRITVLQLSAETVQFKVKLKRVLPKVLDDLRVTSTSFTAEDEEDVHAKKAHAG